MSIFPTKILLATDGSEEAELAALRAVDLADATDSELHVVHVGGVPILLESYPGRRSIVNIVPKKASTLGPNACISRIRVLFGSLLDPEMLLAILWANFGGSFSSPGNRISFIKSPNSPPATNKIVAPMTYIMMRETTSSRKLQSSVLILRMIRAAAISITPTDRPRRAYILGCRPRHLIPSQT